MRLPERVWISPIVLLSGTDYISFSYCFSPTITRCGLITPYLGDGYIGVS